MPGKIKADRLRLPMQKTVKSCPKPGDSFARTTACSGTILSLATTDRPRETSLESALSRMHCASIASAWLRACDPY